MTPVHKKSLLTLNVNNLPILENALGPGVSFQPLFVDTSNGIWCIRAFFDAGITLPAHFHTGPVHAYTVSGCWLYAEYPDQRQTAGSYLYEPAGDAPHLFQTPADNVEVTEVIFTVFGANVNVDADGKMTSVMDAQFIENLVKGLQSAQQLDCVPYIRNPGATIFSS